MQKLLRETFPLAILAGICISIGCVVNLRVGGVAGAVLFAFGLTTVVYYGLKLYTGTAGLRLDDRLRPARLHRTRLKNPRRTAGERPLGVFPAGHRLRIHYDHRR